MGSGGEEDLGSDIADGGVQEEIVRARGSPAHQLDESCGQVMGSVFCRLRIRHSGAPRHGAWQGHARRCRPGPVSRGRVRPEIRGRRPGRSADTGQTGARLWPGPTADLNSGSQPDRPVVRNVVCGDCRRQGGQCVTRPGGRILSVGCELGRVHTEECGDRSRGRRYRLAHAARCFGSCPGLRTRRRPASAESCSGGRRCGSTRFIGLPGQLRTAAYVVRSRPPLRAVPGSSSQRYAWFHPRA